jgi:hypothetical protein
MQVLCKASKTAGDVQCSVCGQGFLVYWTRTSASERAKMQAVIVRALQAQHAEASGSEAHPEAGFNLPEWNGEPRFSAAALLGNAPEWATA